MSSVEVAPWAAGLWDMKIGELLEVRPDFLVRRVPGGWLWIELRIARSREGTRYDFEQPPVFVPYSPHPDQGNG